MGQMEYSMDNTIVLGGMFFQQFYGYFFNAYDFETDTDEVDVINHALIYKKLESTSCGYIGSSVMTNQSNNPFEPPSMPSWFWWFFGTFMFLYIMVSGFCCAVSSAPRSHTSKRQRRMPLSRRR